MGLLSRINPVVAGIVLFLLLLQFLVLRSVGFSDDDTIQTTPKKPSHSPAHPNHDNPPPERAGIWGPPSSSVNWCEPDYVFSLYIAEFWNTLSSLCMASVGIIGRLTASESVASQKKRGVWNKTLSDVDVNGQRRVKWTWIALEVVGWGSVLFHGSLSWATQALDEVPMVWTCALNLTTLATSRFMRPKVNSTLASTFSIFLPAKREKDGLRAGLMSWTMVVYVIACAFLTTAFRGPVQFVMFHSLFGMVQWSSTALIVWIFVARRKALNIPYMNSCNTKATTQEKSEWQIRHQQNLKRLFLTGGILYCSGVGIWLTDLHGCEWMTNHGVPIPSWTSDGGFQWKWINPQGHAIWHLFVSVGFYHLNMLAAYDRMCEAFTVYGAKEVERIEKEGEENIKEDGEADVRDLRPDVIWVKGLWPIVRVSRVGEETKKLQ